MAQDTFSRCRDCPEAALSFSETCWDHADREAYTGAFWNGLASLSGRQASLNLKKAHLRDLDFSGFNLSGSSFSQARLTGCSFIGSWLSECDLIGAHLNACDFVGADMQRANLTKSVVSSCSFSHADLRGAYFVEAAFRDADFMGACLFDSVFWSVDLTGARNLKLSSFRNPDNRKKRPSYHVSEESALGAFESYGNLKHYFYGAGLYDAGSWASYRGLKMERRHFFEKRDPRFFPSLMMDLLSGYTEKPGRVILSSVLIVFVFAMFYFAFNVPVYSFGDIQQRIDFWDSLYFSFITFTTVGYGDFTPRPVFWFRAAACIEAFSGPFMAGLYIFTLTRRYSAS